MEDTGWMMRTYRAIPGFLILYSGLMCSTLQAETHESIYRIGETYHLIVSENGISANRDCMAFKDTCLAIKKAKTLRGLASIESGLGGKNPMSLICSKKMSGRVVVATNEDGDSNSFCILPDDSMIATASLNNFIK